MDSSEKTVDNVLESEEISVDLSEGTVGNVFQLCNKSEDTWWEVGMDISTADNIITSTPIDANQPLNFTEVDEIMDPVDFIVNPASVIEISDDSTNGDLGDISAETTSTSFPDTATHMAQLFGESSTSILEKTIEGDVEISHNEIMEGISWGSDIIVEDKLVDISWGDSIDLDNIPNVED